MEACLLVLMLFAQHASHGAGSAPGNATMPSSSAPVERKEEPRVPVEVPQAEQGRIGLKTAPVEKKQVQYVIRTVGNVTADETTEAHVHTRINGWIDQLFVTRVGEQVIKGQALYALYAPELLATQQEYLSARGGGEIGAQVARTALERMRLWGVPEEELTRLKSTRRASKAVTFRSPVAGYVIAKNALLGMYVTPEMELYYLANLAKVWIVVRLYEFDLSAVAVGDKAVVTLTYDPAVRFEGTLSYIYPEVDPETRTAKARIEVNNSALKLRPGMFTNIELERNLGEQMVVPDDAVLETGTRRIVFVKKGATSFEPREVAVGPHLENEIVIRGGLQPDESVVTSALFLIDAESKMQAVVRSEGKTPGGHGEHGKE